MEIIYHHFETLSSTNDWIKAHLKTIIPNILLVVSAEEQTGARGQYGRRWLSPKGENVYASFGFFVDETQDPLSLTRLMALSAARALSKYQVNCQIKWPNDLMIDAKKIGGILCETETFPTQLARISHTFLENSHTLSPELHRQDGEAVSAQARPGHPDNESQVTERRFFSKKCEKPGLGITLGIGLNVNMTQKNINLIDQPATSILLETGVTHNPLEVLFTLKDYFAADLDRFLPQKKLTCL